MFNKNILCPWVYNIDMQYSEFYGTNGLNNGLLTLIKWNPLKLSRGMARPFEWASKNRHKTTNTKNIYSENLSK